MRECKMRHVKLTRQMNGIITIIFKKVTLFLFLKDEMRLCKGRRVTLTSRIFHSSMSSNRIHRVVANSRFLLVLRDGLRVHQAVVNCC